MTVCSDPQIRTRGVTEVCFPDLRGQSKDKKMEYLQWALTWKIQAIWSPCTRGQYLQSLLEILSALACFPERSVCCTLPDGNFRTQKTRRSRNGDLTCFIPDTFSPFSL